RGNADARALAHADWCLRRKADGRFLAAFGPQGLHALMSRLAREPGLGAMLERLAVFDARKQADAGAVPLAGLQARLGALGLDEVAYAADTGLVLVAEPDRLEYAGRDRWRRPLWLRASAAAAWQRMRAAAAVEGI